VEFAIELEVLRFIAARDRGVHFGLELFELFLLDEAHTLRAQPAAQGFEFAHRFEHVSQFVDAELSDHHALARGQLDHAARGEFAQCFADRCARGVEAFGERGFFELLARFKRAVDDLVAQQSVDLGGERRHRHGGGLSETVSKRPHYAPAAQPPQSPPRISGLCRPMQCTRERVHALISVYEDFNKNTQIT
jgi:hypothetical protein